LFGVFIFCEEIDCGRVLKNIHIVFDYDIIYKYKNSKSVYFWKNGFLEFFVFNRMYGVFGYIDLLFFGILQRIILGIETLNTSKII